MPDGATHVSCGARVKRTAPWRSILPNILVYIDIRQGRPTGASLFAVSETRRVARLAGASVYAVAVSPPLDTAELDTLARPIGEAGADKLLLCEASDFAGAPLDVTHGRGLDAAAARVPPMMVLFPAGGPGAALGPSLAARLGGPFAPWCDFLTSETEGPVNHGASRVQLIRCRPDGRSRRRLDPLEIERPIVAVLGAGQCSDASGRVQDLEVEVLTSVSAMDGPTVDATDEAADPHAHLSLASLLVLIGEGDDGVPLISADALPGDPARGVAVAYARDVPPSVLAACCPDILLRIGSSSARTARSPRTRVILATTAANAPESALEEVDVLWQFRAPSELTPSAIAALLAEMRGDSRTTRDVPS